MKVDCPICKKQVEWEDNPYRPFCSERCKLTDLGEWAMEKHAIPSDSENEEKPKNPPKIDEK